jgi:hypothetical protein
MVAKLVRDSFDREGWLFELKWDGFRAIAEKGKQGVLVLAKPERLQETLSDDCARRQSARQRHP